MVCAADGIVRVSHMHIPPVALYLKIVLRLDFTHSQHLNVMRHHLVNNVNIKIYY